MKNTTTLSTVAGLAATGTMIAGAAQAEMVYQDIGVRLSSGEEGSIGVYELDLDQDGAIDFFFDLKGFSFKDSLGRFETATVSGTRPGRIEKDVKSITFANVSTSASKFITLFELGEDVSSDTFEDSSGFGRIFDSSRLQLIEGDIGLDVAVATLVDEPASMGLQEGESAFIGLSLTDGGSVNYGWAEVERGSLTILRTGYQTTAGAAAPTGPVAPVPLPASLPLLALGAAGLMGMRRRAA